MSKFESITIAIKNNRINSNQGLALVWTINAINDLKYPIEKRAKDQFGVLLSQFKKIISYCVWICICVCVCVCVCVNKE